MVKKKRFFHSINEENVHFDFRVQIKPMGASLGVLRVWGGVI